MRIETARTRITGPARQIPRDSSGCSPQRDFPSPARGQGSNRAPSASAGSSGRATQNTKKRSGNRKCEITGQPCTTHQPLGQALSLARRRSCRRPAFPAAPNPVPRKHPHPPDSQQRAPRLPRNTPNPHATARLVAHLSRKTAQRKVTHITNKIVKQLILILLMETPETPRRGKSPKPCHIRTYSVIIPPKS